MAEGAPAAAPLHATHLHRRDLPGRRLLAGGHARQPTAGQGLDDLVRGPPEAANVKDAVGFVEGGPLVDGGKVESAPGRLDMG